ncbi:MFS transporter [Nocardioides sp. zg-ZUI104]|uniref:MFS transporter n=1 Tax=Nocardioides faecalis TaxID=2803858 RepID=UPI001BCA8C02|nr:MFS transporter [Nocardioides faecalis]MBS4753426.1 MFS transporter [Nocardioides faecalis]
MSHHNYRLYLAGSLVSNVGTWMQRVAQDWLVLTIPGNGGAALGLTTGLQFLPVLLLSPYAGVLADRMSKRRLLQITQTVMALSALALGVIAALGVAQTWHVYLIAFVFGIGSAFDAPARQAFVSEMVGSEDVTNAVSLNSAVFNAARLVGPGIAGLLIGLGGGGMQATGWVILINAVSYVAVIYQLRRMDPEALHSPRPVAREPGMLRAGVAYVRTQPKMMLILVVAFFVGTFGMNFQITSALMATEVFGKGATEYGVLGSVLAIGSLAGALVAAGRTRVRLRLLLGAAVAFGAAEIVAGVVPTYLTFVLLCPVLGFASITVLNSCNALLQTESTPAMRGRVLAIYMTIVLGGTPLGGPFIGWIGEHFGARWTLIVGGALVLVGVAAAVSVLGRSRRRQEALASPEREPAMLHA